MLSLSFRANYPTLYIFKMSFRIDYEIESYHPILIDPSNQCEINYGGFGKEVDKPDQIEIVHEGKEQNEIIPLKAHGKAKQTRKDSFKCNTCDKKFTQRGSLKIHIAAVHDGKKPYICEICNSSFALKHRLIQHMAGKNVHKTIEKMNSPKTFVSNKQLKNHISIGHDGNKRFHCHVCDITYASNQKRNRHIESVHNMILVSNEKNCESCDASFQFQHQLESHMAKAHIEALKCIICNKIFKSTVTLKNHVAAVHVGKKKNPEGEKTFPCDICNITLATKPSKKRHLANVHGEIFEQKDKNTKCKICKANFKFPFQLKSHIANVHEEKRPYVCELCGSSFGLQSSLWNHKKTHASIKNDEVFNCDRCGKIYTQKSHLMRHIAAVHNENLPFQCNVCEIKFSRKSNLRYHIALTHQEINCDT